MKERYANTLYLILAIVIALLLSFAVLALLTEAVCSSDAWFRREYTKYSDESNKPGNIIEVNSKAPEEGVRYWITVQQAVEITSQMVDYCYGRSESLDNVKTKIYSASYPDGHTEEFFNQREKHHLADCREYFAGSHKSAIVELAIALLLLAAIRTSTRTESRINARVKKKTPAFARVFRKVSLSFAAVLDAACILFALNFDTAYDWAHGILFNNYLWILDPARDNLIMLMQTEIICDTTVLILIIWNVILLGSVAMRSCIRRSSTGSLRQPQT